MPSPLTRARRAVRAATRAGLRSLQRDAALGSLPGFEDAWGTAHRVPGWFGETEAAVFWAVVHEARPATVVEIGSYLGRSTTLLGLALRHADVPAARLVAIDPHTGDRQNMRALGISTIPTQDLFCIYMKAAGIGDLLDVRVAPSADVAADWHDPVDLLFVDGWHSKRGVLADARGFGPHLTDRGIVCFDDYTAYKSVRRGADLACTELGLVRYGTVAAQLWAGRPEVAPAGVVRALRIERLVAAARRLSLRG